MNNIYSRPMFQTPQQRSGGGIMAGVAPVNMQDGGDPGVMDWAFGDDGYVGNRLLSDLGETFSLRKTDEGSGANLRDFTDLIFDPDDPIDRATLGLMTVPPVFAYARLASMGVKGAKLAQQISKMDKVKDLYKRMTQTEEFRKGVPLATTAYGLNLGTDTVSGLMGYAADPEVSGPLVETVKTEAPLWGELARDIATLPGLAIDRGMEWISPSASAEELNAEPEELYAEELNGGIGGLDVEAEPEEGGIADLPASIWEAREMHLPTFMRDDDELAAVTVEDLEESEFDNLTDYLNAMDFDEESGEYVLKKAEGGEAKKEMPRDISGFLAFSELENLDAFMKLSDKDKQAYIKAYKDNRGLIKGMAGNPFVGGIAQILDGLNILPEMYGSAYDAAKYSPLAKAIGLTGPIEEALPDDPSFSEGVEMAKISRAPTLREVERFAAPPPLPVSPEAQEKAQPEPEPGMFRKIFGGIRSLVDTMSGRDLPEAERRAYMASQGRRELGESKMEVYNRELNAIRNAESAADLRRAQAESYGVGDIEQGVEYLRTIMPEETTDAQLLDKYLETQNRSSLFTTKDRVTEIGKLATALLEDIQTEAQYKELKAANKELGVITPDFNTWVMGEANKMFNMMTGTPTSLAATGSQLEVSNEEYAKIVEELAKKG